MPAELAAPGSRKSSLGGFVLLAADALGVSRRPGRLQTPRVGPQVRSSVERLSGQLRERAVSACASKETPAKRQRTSGHNAQDALACNHVQGAGGVALRRRDRKSQRRSCSGRMPTVSHSIARMAARRAHARWDTQGALPHARALKQAWQLVLCTELPAAVLRRPTLRKPRVSNGSSSPGQGTERSRELRPVPVHLDDQTGRWLWIGRASEGFAAVPVSILVHMGRGGL